MFDDCNEFVGKENLLKNKIKSGTIRSETTQRPKSFQFVSPCFLIVLNTLARKRIRKNGSVVIQFTINMVFEFTDDQIVYFNYQSFTTLYFIRFQMKAMKYSLI